MVASWPRGGPASGGAGVSIPFIAGQWSLHFALQPLEVNPRGFNPLHCGAVVASLGDDADRRGGGDHVSIPFIAGQWSLQDEARACLAAIRVSIPFIAGQWSLPARGRWPGTVMPGVSIPFIAGQWSLHRHEGGESEYEYSFQSPSLRGSGRFTKSSRWPATGPAKFQSPSLRGSGRFALATLAAWRAEARFNPLHCGAVVASREGHGRRH